jgi:hypothetical protein
MAKRHQQIQTTESYIAARIILTLFCLILAASLLALIIDLTSTYILIVHGHIHTGTGSIVPPRGSIFLSSRTLMEYPLAIVAGITIIWVAKAAWNASHHYRQHRR